MALKTGNNSTSTQLFLDYLESIGPEDTHHGVAKILGLACSATVRAFDTRRLLLRFGYISDDNFKIIKDRLKSIL